MIRVENIEVWGFEHAIRRFPEYKVTTNGDVIGKRGKPMKGHIDHCGYKEVILSYYPYSKQVLVHRLVLSTFNPIDGMENLDVNHIDGNKLNNRLDNLEWCTRSENIIHSYKNGLQNNVTNKYGNYKVLTEHQIQSIKELHEKGLIDKDIADIIGCSRELVSRKIRKMGIR